MKHKIVTKLWLGKYVSVRDYELKAAIQEGGMIIEYLSEKMHLSVDDIKHIKPSGKFHEAKFVGNIKAINWLTSHGSLAIVNRKSCFYEP
jgi:response regulator RpfG family c-di-GMP phosphodiesterase